MPTPQKQAVSAAWANVTAARELWVRLMTPSLTCVSFDRPSVPPLETLVRDGYRITVFIRCI
jgi:hypothetical protein